MRQLACTAFLAAAVLLFWHCGMVAQDRSAGLNLAYNEFSAMCQIPVGEKESLRISANLDMTKVISGKVLYPGVSADAAYLFRIWGKRFLSGESMMLSAGPGACAGYVRDHRGHYGLMASLTGYIGFEYIFLVPVSISLSLEPCLGVHLNRDRFGYVNMDFYRYGLLYSLLPHVGIRYRF